MERMSMRPDPSVFELPDGGRIPAEWLGIASASRFDRENSTEFSFRWPVKWVEPAPLPGDLLATGSAG